MKTFSRTSITAATVALTLAACGGGETVAPSGPRVSEPGINESGPAATDVPTAAAAVPGPDLGTQERPTLGDPDAPVTLIEFSDFLCPFCQKFATEVEPDIVARYVETGQVRIVWSDFPARGERAVDAAIAGRAAMRQDAFWEYHHELFQRQDSSSYTRDALIALADELGLDTEQFATDLDDPTLEEHVLEDLARGQRYGVRGTPSFLVGNQPIVGAQPLEAFTQAIDAQLAAAHG